MQCIVVVSDYDRATLIRGWGASHFFILGEKEGVCGCIPVCFIVFEELGHFLISVFSLYNYRQ